nr:zf-TFIIB domain-containing protein [Symmachiella dynata]
MWFDPDELRTALQRATSPPPAGPKSQINATPLPCPKCQTEMPVVDYAYHSGIDINRCNRCLGVWLSRGQFDQIAQYGVGTPTVNRLAANHIDIIKDANRRLFGRELLRSRFVSGFVAVLYLVSALVFGTPEVALKLVRFLLLPLLCIWFADGIGNLTGISLGLGRPVITEKTPGDFVAIGGWLLMLCPAFVALVAW